MNIDILMKRANRLASVLAQQTKQDDLGHTKERLLAAKNDVNIWSHLFSGYDPIRYHIELQELASKHKRLLVEGPPNSGKSESLTINRTLWLIGNNPNIRVRIVCASADKAYDWVRRIAQGLQSAIFKLVFPDIRLTTPWTGNCINVCKTRPGKAGSTVKGTGIESSTGLGDRVDLMILDDILTAENTYSKPQRERVLRTIQSTMINGRVTTDGQIIMIGNTWTRDDAMHELAKNPIYHHSRVTACDDEITYSAFPEIWSIEKLQERRAELGTLGFKSLFMCEPMGDEDSRFKLEWFDALSPKPWTDVYHCYPGERIVIGLDPGIGQDRQHDPSAFVVLLRDTVCRHHVLNVETGHWTGEELISKMVQFEKRYSVHHFRVESIAAQRFLIQWAKNRVNAPIVSHNTSASSTSISGKVWAFEKLPMEAERGALLICRDKQGQMTIEGAALRDGLMSYRPGVHTDDRVMGLAIAYAGFHSQLGGTYRVESR